MKSKFQIIFFILLTALLLSACQPEVQIREVEVDGLSSAGAPASDFYAYDAMGASDSDGNWNGSALPQQAQAQERLIIRTGELRMIVEDTEESLGAIASLVNGVEGWIVNSSVSQHGQGDQAKSGSMTVRIPANQFDAMIDQIREIALEVTHESTQGQDVTEEYVDLAARLGNLEATAARVRAFLDEARNVEDALNVNRELSRLESEIEAMKGRLQYLSQSAAYSTLTIYITPDALSQPIQIGGWRPQGVARDAVEALVSTLQGVADLLIWVAIYLLPLAIIIGIPGWLLLRFLTGFWRRRRTAVAPNK